MENIVKPSRFAALVLFLSTPFATSPGYAVGHAYGNAAVNIGGLQLLRPDGSAFSSGDFAAYTTAYRAGTLLTYPVGKVVEQSVGPSGMPVDLPHSCTGPACPAWAENQFDVQGYAPLVFAYADQQTFGEPAGNAAGGLAIRGVAAAASSTNLRASWGRWQSTSVSRYSAGLQLGNDAPLSVAFDADTLMYATNWDESEHDYIRSEISTTVSLTNLVTGEQWLLAPDELNRAIDSRLPSSNMGIPSATGPTRFVLDAGMLDAEVAYRLDIAVVTSIDALTLSPAPEPATGAMYSVGLLGLLWWRARKGGAS
jgi:hypothetical protein